MSFDSNQSSWSPLASLLSGKQKGGEGGGGGMGKIQIIHKKNTPKHLQLSPFSLRERVYLLPTLLFTWLKKPSAVQALWRGRWSWCCRSWLFLLHITLLGLISQVEQPSLEPHGRCHPKCPARFHRLAKVEPRLALQLKKGGNKWLLWDGRSPQRWEAAAGSPASTSSPATSHLFQGA